MHLESLETRRCFAAVAGTVQTLASGANVGEYTSVAINPITQQPAVAFYDVTNGNLDFTEYTGKQWKSSVIDSAGDVGKHASLKFDRSGNPWIAYDDSTTGNLKIAHRAAGVWSTSVIDTAGEDGSYASLAITKAGLPVVAYDGTTASAAASAQDVLKLATDTAHGWSFQTVDDHENDLPAAYCSLALDGHDRPRIAFEGEGDVDYASFDGNVWHIKIIDSSAFSDVGVGLSLALDNAGYAHISYTYPMDTGAAGGTFYQQVSGPGAGFREVDTDVNLSEGGDDDIDATAILLNSKGQPIVAYASRYITIATESHGAFVDKPAKGTAMGGYLSMAMKKNGQLVVAYYDSTSQDLKLFTSA